MFPRKRLLIFFLLIFFNLIEASDSFIFNVEDYKDEQLSPFEKLSSRITVQPINLFFLVVFIIAIFHSFFSHRFMKMSKMEQNQRKGIGIQNLEKKEKIKKIRFQELLYFFSEIEVIFGFYCVPVLLAITWIYGLEATYDYLNREKYQESLFIVVAMAIASTYPIVRFAEAALNLVARFGGGTPAAWWLSILLIGPLMGAFLKETIAMTISSLLLGKYFFSYKPEKKLAYFSLALLLANISIGGLLTNFASSAIIVVKHIWKWDTQFMFWTFGLKAWLAILINTISLFFFFKKDFQAVNDKFFAEKKGKEKSSLKVPLWITIVHLLWLGWLILNNNTPIIALGSFVLFLGFYQATSVYQTFLDLREPIMVGFFLASLMILGGLQAWWISPIVESLSNELLMGFGLLLTSINQNAVIAYIASHIPHLDAEKRYYFIASVMAGGGLTFLANAPNLIAYSLLGKYFNDDIQPGRHFLAALFPTLIAVLCFYLLRF